MSNCIPIASIQNLTIVVLWRMKIMGNLSWWRNSMVTTRIINEKIIHWFDDSAKSHKTFTDLQKVRINAILRSEIGVVTISLYHLKRTIHKIEVWARVWEITSSGNWRSERVVKKDTVNVLWQGIFVCCISRNKWYMIALLIDWVYHFSFRFKVLIKNDERDSLHIRHD